VRYNQRRVFISNAPYQCTADGARLNHQSNIFGKVEIRLDAARLKSVTSSLHSPLDEGTAIPASQPTAGTPFSLQLASKQSRLNGNTCSDGISGANSSRDLLRRRFELVIFNAGRRSLFSSACG
jgi:hypothetical protein